MWWKFLKNKNEKIGSAERAQQNEEIRSSGRAPLTEISKRVREVELVTKRKMSTALAGQYRSRFKGQGMQFADSRIYQYGDDIRHIDWRTSARMQETFIKTFEEERELNIIFAVDMSASEIFGSTGLSKREALSIALASIGFSAIANNDRVGLLIFTDQVERFVPAKKSRKHILRLVDELLTFEPKSKGSKLNVAMDFLSGTIKHGSVIILASDFFSAFDRRTLRTLSRKHDFICMRAIDPRDTELPNVGLLRIEDPETGEEIIISTNSAAFREKYQKDQTAFQEKLALLLKREGAAVLDIATDADASKTLYKFFQSRKGRK